jgi:hypothetical protein
LPDSRVALSCSDCLAIGNDCGSSSLALSNWLLRACATLLRSRALLRARAKGYWSTAFHILIQEKIFGSVRKQSGRPPWPSGPNGRLVETALPKTTAQITRRELAVALR